MTAETIVAIATPSGRGGVGVIRLSGADAHITQIAQSLLHSVPTPRIATHRLFLGAQGEALDDGIALYFPAPHSFTGESVLELQGHGGRVVLDMLVQRCLALGARLARPGEFSERAFLNEKLDLAQAEAIADLIDSGSEQAARSALRSLQGEFSQAIEQLVEQLIKLRVYTEAALDFPDEEVDFLAEDSVKQRLQSIHQQLQHIFTKAHQGSLLRNGMQLVIIGQPNAGKSSLLNALAGQDSAIVTDIAGTTRDVLRERIHLDGLPLHLIDTAGLRDSSDPIEQQGIERAWREVARADLVLLLIDHTVSTTHEGVFLTQLADKIPENTPVLKVFNKIDLSQHPAGKKEGCLYISARSGQGIAALKEELKRLMGFQSSGEDTFMARRRHLHALARTQTAVDIAGQHLTDQAGELMAEELRIAQDALGEITGRFTPDDLLGEIFSSFCIGK